MSISKKEQEIFICNKIIEVKTCKDEQNQEKDVTIPNITQMAKI